MMSLPPCPTRPHAAGGALLPLPRAAAVCSSTYCHIALARDPKRGQFGWEHLLLEMPKGQRDPSCDSAHAATSPKVALSFLGDSFGFIRQPRDALHF